MPAQYTKRPEMALDPTKTYTASLRTGSGTIKVELFAKEAPITVNNFVFLAREGFYDNGSFHRVIKGFMIQGGCPRGDGTGGPGYRFSDEPVSRPYLKGTLAMANSGPNTNGSQFFIVHGERAGLPPNYTIFGMLTEGADVLDALANAPVTAGSRGERSKPAKRLVIESIEIEEA
jgi:cyclophilin family peptidyl-prolyl cis-trans isomerase